MIFLRIAIASYILGLFTFYLCATFDIYYWKWLYFGWSKVSDCGLIMWSFLFFHFKGEVKKVIRPLFLFSILRFFGDAQSWFTGIGVNNDFVIAVLFLVLSVVTGYLILRPNSKLNVFLSEHL